jgi:hypothetical protein
MPASERPGNQRLPIAASAKYHCRTTKPVKGHSLTSRLPPERAAYYTLQSSKDCHGPRNSLGAWEVALVKAFIQFTDLNDQEILPYFSRPGRSINHRVIAEIRAGSHFATAETAPEEQLRLFRERWFSYSVKTGKQREVEEHVMKAREAQIAAMNRPGFAGGNLV